MEQQPLQLSISAKTADELRSKFVECGKVFGLNIGEVGAPAAPAQEASEKTTAKSRAKKETAAEVATETKEVEKPHDIFGTGDAKQEAAATKEDALKALTNLNDLKGTEVAISVLKKFDALSLGQLKAESYGAFIKAANEAAGNK